MKKENSLENDRRIRDGGETISVIVPVFNAGEHLEESVESLLAQTWTDLEILLIDDGSTDGSGDVCDTLAAKDGRIRVIHKENTGVSDVRNLGISLSKGRFIAFADADDVVSEKYIEHLAGILEKEDADISITLPIKFQEGTDVSFKEDFDEEKTVVHSSESAIRDMLYRYEIPIYPWGKLYRKELFDKVRYPAGEIYEDLSTEYKLFDQAGRIAVNPVRDYGYRQWPKSLTHAAFPEQKMIQIPICADMVRFVRKAYPGIEAAAVSKTFVTVLNLYQEIPGGKDYAGHRRKCVKILKRYRLEVLRDKNNKKMTRMIALLSCVSIHLTRWAGKAYTGLKDRGLLILKTPI